MSLDKAFHEMSAALHKRIEALEAFVDHIRSAGSSDRRAVTRPAKGKATQKRNDGPCHFEGCKNKARRPLNMMCAEVHGKLPKAQRVKLNEKWKKAHAQ